jgi:hypothetical protein
MLAVINFAMQDLSSVAAVAWIASWISGFLAKAPVRRVIRWHSPIIVPAVFGLGATMALEHHFLAAYACFALLGAYAVLLWLTSDHLWKRGRSLATRRVRRRADFPELVLRYRLLRWGVIVVILFCFSVCLVLTRNFQKEVTITELKKIRDETFDHLDILPLPLNVFDDRSNIWFSVVNGAHSNISEHTFGCLIRGMYGPHFFAHNSAMFSREVITLGVLGGGRGETVYCHSPIKGTGSLNCIDVDVWLDFALKDQPNDRLKKYYRFMGFTTPGGFKWTQQSPDDAKGFC